MEKALGQMKNPSSSVQEAIALRLLASLARALGKRASMRRERNLDELSSYLSEHDWPWNKSPA